MHLDAENGRTQRNSPKVVPNDSECVRILSDYAGRRALCESRSGDYELSQYRVSPHSSWSMICVGAGPFIFICCFIFYFIFETAFLLFEQNRLR